ncbi:hypothetical protein ACNM69_002030 [Escherichia coli]
MNTLFVDHQFTADTFRDFIIRTLTDTLPAGGNTKDIARFILRNPAFNGGWLLFLATRIHKKSRIYKNITVTVTVDKYLSCMNITISGIPECPDIPFCDFFIRRRQVIYLEVREEKQ